MLVIQGLIILISIGLVFFKKLPAGEAIVIVALAVIGGCQLLVQKPAQAIITRPDYGEEAAEYTFYFQQEEADDQIDIPVEVPARTYTDAQLDEMAAEVYELLPEIILGSNDSAEEIYASLTLVEEVSGYPFEISWISDDELLISGDGTVFNEELEESKICRLTAELSYDGYVAIQDFYVNIQPGSLTEQEQIVKRLTKVIDELLREQDTEDTVALPTELSGGRLYGSIPDPKLTLLWPFLGIAWIVFKRARAREAAKEQTKKRMDDLEYMYPDFVNQMVLYLSAGMTIRTAMAQIMNGLETKENSAGNTLHQELACMFHGLDSGISEKQAYQSFGSRCGCSGYRKLMSLMVQTIFVGGKGLLARLEELEVDAFIKRKEYAKTKGEEASTKLLIPMVILLAIVMLLLVVPGFYGMGQ